MKLTERTPFYLIATIFLFVTIVLSIIATFNINKNVSDFFPNEDVYNGKIIHDNKIVDKICWYFS